MRLHGKGSFSIAAGMVLTLFVGCSEKDSAPESESLPEQRVSSQHYYDTGPHSVLFTNHYRVTPDFLLSSLFDPDLSPSIDPFASDLPVGPGERKTIRDVLENAGIRFGTGSSAMYLKETSQVVVRNDGYQMELVDLFFEDLFERFDRSVAIRIEIFEMSESEISKTLKDAPSIGDQTESYERIVELVRQRLATRKATMFSVQRPGEVSKSFAGVEEGIVKGHQLIDGVWTPEVQRIEVGTSLEVHATIPMKSNTVDLEFQLQHDLDKPKIREIPKLFDTGKSLVIEDLERHIGKLKSRVSVRDGQMQLLGSWPVSSDDSIGVRTQVVFVKVEIWKLGD